ncbi:MAG: hypothetical protein NT116_03690 [Candidatus Parcubacteria bacterium]|nr:hypothetical protein [Candidatus Parcubacteria bacterium]
MDESAEKLIERLKQHANKYHWHGYTHSNCRSRKFNGQRQSGQSFYRMCLKTIIPDKLINIQINRVYKTGYWAADREEFDPQKHFYWYELIIEDALKRNGAKTIISLDCKKDSEDIAIFQELFETILKFSVFPDKYIPGSNKNVLTLLLEAI